MMQSAGLPNVARGFVPIHPLQPDLFKPYGEVVEASQATPNYPINQGSAVRFDPEAHIDVGMEGGLPRLSIFRAEPVILPLRIAAMERHPLGSQAFFPLSPHPYLVLVALGEDTPALGTLRCFSVRQGQGVNYARGTWHHSLLALHARSDFLVIDRAADGRSANCDESSTLDWQLWIGTPESES